MSITGRETDWVYRGGYRALVLYDPDDGSAIGTGFWDGAPPSREGDRIVTGAGTLAETGGRWLWAPTLYDGASIAWMRAKIVADADVQALAVGIGQARHVRWAEPIPIHLDPADGGRGTLTGETVRLESHAYDAAVSHRPDLLAPGVFASGGDWTHEDAGAGSAWGTVTDGLTALSAPAYSMAPDAGDTETLWTQVVLPAVGPLGPATVGGSARFAVAFAVRLDGVDTAVASGSTVEVTLNFLDYGDRNVTQASILSAATTPAGRSVEPVVGDGTDTIDEMVAGGIAAETWVCRVAVEVTAPGGAASDPVTVSAPTLLTRTASGSALPGSALTGAVGLKMLPGGNSVLIFDPSSLTGTTAIAYTVIVPSDAVRGTVDTD